MLSPDFLFEKSLVPPTTRFLLGIDEVGRGPWAGPVTIGAFLLDLQTFSPDEFIKLKVRDSKKLSEVQRKNIQKYFKQNNYSFTTFSATSQEIDNKGIAICLHDLVSSALTHYRSQFDFCLIDGNYNINNFFSLSLKGETAKPRGISIIKGDSLCFSVASASIVAKVDRDEIMDKYDQQFPQYGFKSHKGYGTSQHLSAIKTYGICPIHRQSYKPIKNIVK